MKGPCLDRKGKKAEAEAAELGLPNLTSRDYDIHNDLDSHYDICHAFQVAQRVRICLFLLSGEHNGKLSVP